MYMYVIYFSAIGASPETPGVGEAGAVDEDSIELTVMDDISSPDSPRLPSRSRKDSESSEEEAGETSESEDRYCTSTFVAQLQSKDIIVSLRSLKSATSCPISILDRK